MNNALVYFGGLLITALALLFGVPYLVDWNSYRGVFEEEASRVLGREVRVGGNVNLRLLPTPYVRFEKIRIADTGTDGGNSIFRAESFTMWLSVPPLLRGVLEANQVLLKRPIIQLAVDKAGSGNWRNFKLNPGLMPFVPKDVALQSVSIFDGILGVTGPDRTDLVRVDGVNGELAAEALEGPYKFKGSLNWGGKKRAVRLATARQDANGDLRFKAAVDAQDTGNAYVFDGRLSDITGKPRLEGEVNAKLNFSLSPASAPVQTAVAPELAPDVEVPAATEGEKQPGPAVKPLAPEPEGGAPRYDLRAKVAGDAAGFKLDDISISLEQGGPPQLITGTANMTWAEKMHLDVTLASRWLDLDRLAGSGEQVVPMAAARHLFEGLAAALPAESNTNTILEFDQLNLGGEAVSGVRLAVSRTNGPLELKEVRASLPGGTKLALAGVLLPDAKIPKLDGKLTISGQSLIRFLGWGLRDKTIGEGRSDGAFSLEGRFALSESAIELSEATADLAGMQVAGDVKLGLGARKRLALMLEGPRIDAAQIRGGIVGLGFLRDVLAGEGEGKAAAGLEGTAPAANRYFDVATTDLSLKLRIAEIVDGARTLKDIEADMAVEGGKLSIPALKFATPEGLYVEAEGDAASVPAAPKGALRTLVSAPTPEAAAAFVRLLDLPAEDEATASRLGSLTPLRVAGTLAFGERIAGAADLALDGRVQGGRLRATLRFDGGRKGWRTSPADITITSESENVERLLSGLLDRKGVRPSDPPLAGRVLFKASGTPETGMLSFASVTADGFNLDYTGNLRLPAAEAAESSGKLRVAAGEGRSAFALAGLRLAEGAMGTPIDGALTLSVKDNLLSFKADGFKIGESLVRGVVAVDRAPGKTPVVTADLEVDKGTFAGVMAPILGRVATFSAAAAPPPPPVPAEARRGVPVPAPAPALEPASSPWPDQAFDLSALADLEGHVKVRFGSLAVEPGLAVGNARIDATLGANGIKVETFEGDAVGGKLKSNFDIEKTPAGIGLKGALRIDVASKAVPAGSPGDVAAFHIDFTGRALSPAALMSDLQGKGEVALGDATLTGLSPAAVAAVAEDALAGKGPSGGEPLVQALAAALKQGQIRLGKVAIPVTIGDGALKLEKVQLEQEEGRATFATAIELGSMKIDSEWQIEPKVLRKASAAGERIFLPAVSVIYVGKLSELASLEPRVTTGSLERELTVRKMERDVDQLEHLRKLDQTRARQQADRQRQLDEERARAATPPAPQPAAPPLDPDAVAPPPGPDAQAAPPLPPDGSAEAPPPAAGDPPSATANAGAQPGVSVDGTVLPPVPAPEYRPPPRKRKPVEAWRPFEQQQ